MKSLPTRCWRGIGKNKNNPREAKISTYYFHLDDGYLIACRQLQRGRTFLRET